MKRFLFLLTISVASAALAQNAEQMPTAAEFEQLSKQLDADGSNPEIRAQMDELIKRIPAHGSAAPSGLPHAVTNAMSETGKCIANLDPAVVERIRQKALSLNARLAALCKAGKPEQVTPTILEHARAMQSDPDAQAAAKCGKGLASAIDNTGNNPSIPQDVPDTEDEQDPCEAFRE